MHCHSNIEVVFCISGESSDLNDNYTSALQSVIGCREIMESQKD